MGGTMLADHHDCGAPLFRYKGEVVCPVCSFEEAGAPQPTPQAENFAASPISAPGEERGSKTDTEAKSAAKVILSPETRDYGEIAHREAVSGDGEKKDEFYLAKEELQTVILQKIREISEKMRDEQDLGRLKSQLEYIKEALKVLGRLRV